MKKILIIILIFFAASIVYSQETGKGGSKKQFLYLLRLEKQMYDPAAWTPEKNSIVMEHFERLKKMLAEGFLILAGRTQVDLDKTIGLVIYEADSLEDAKKIAENDPAVKAGIMTVEVFPYEVALIKEIQKK
ncbi:MAG: YciI family protein [Melioribacteraceae bacterium]